MSNFIFIHLRGPQLTVFSIALNELMVRFALPLCTCLPHSTSPTPISSVTAIMDMSNVSLSALWNWRKHLQESSTLSTANYPETLCVIAIVNSPPFFPTVWNWVKVCLVIKFKAFEEMTRHTRVGSMRAHVIRCLCWVRIQDRSFVRSSTPKISQSLMVVIWTGSSRTSLF